MTIEARMQEWLQTKQVKVPEPKALDAKTGEGCYTCARKREDIKRLVMQAAYKHLDMKRQKEGIMGKIVLLTDDGCPPCEEVKKTLEPLIQQGEIEVMNFSQCAECDRSAVDRAGIKTFPSLAIRSDDGLLVSPLSLAPRAPAPEPVKVQPQGSITRIEPAGASIEEDELDGDDN